MPTLLHGPGCNFGNSRGCTLVVHYCADLQPVRGFRCYENIARGEMSAGTCIRSMPGLNAVYVEGRMRNIPLPQ